MFFTYKQIGFVALLGLLYLAATFYTARNPGRSAKNIATLLGCSTFVLMALFAARNLYGFFITTDDVRVYVGKRQTWLWVIDPSKSPFQYLLLIACQIGTVIGSLVLGYSVYSYRHD